MIRLYNGMDIDHDINFNDDEFSQIITKEQFFNELFPLYKSSKREQEKILKQLLTDFHRQNVVIDDYKVTNIFQYLEHIYSNMANRNNNIFNEILQLSQQTPLSIPLKAVLQKLNSMNIEKTYIVTELENVHEANPMHIIIENNRVEVHKNLRVFDPEKLINISKLAINITYTTDVNTLTINYKFSSFVDSYGFELLYE